MREARAAARGGRWRRRRGPALLAAALGGILLLAGARLLALRAAAVEGGVHELHTKGNARAGGGLHAGAWAGIGPAGVPDVVPGAGVRAAELVSNARCSARRQHLALSSTPHNAERAELYSSIAAKLLHGPSSSPVPQSLAPLAAGVLSQGLQITDLYERGPGGKWTPRSLPPLEVPVRAIVVPVSVDVDAAGALGQATETALQGLGVSHGIGAWAQDSKAYHATLYHASHHLDEVPADGGQLESEIEAVRSVAASNCAFELELDRVVATDGGVLFACWTIGRRTTAPAGSAGDGTSEPVALRNELRAALPRSPIKQIAAQPVMLHTTLARLFEVPGGGAEALAVAAEKLTASLCGLRARIGELHVVYEHDKLALATGGRVTRTVLPMRDDCTSIAA